MKRLLRILRRTIGLALLGWSAWTLLRETVWRSPHRFSAAEGFDEGRPTGIRIVPLAPAEAAAAIALEHEQAGDLVGAELYRQAIALGRADWVLEQG